MSDGNYDRALLSQADDSTPTNGRVSFFRCSVNCLEQRCSSEKKQNKQFYDADLLKEYDEQERQRQAAPASRSQTDLENGHGRQKDEYATASTPLPQKRPWYKTRNGIIAIVVIVIVVLGAVIVGRSEARAGRAATRTAKRLSQQFLRPGRRPQTAAALRLLALRVVLPVVDKLGVTTTTTTGKDNIAVPTAGVSDPESAGTSA